MNIQDKVRRYIQNHEDMEHLRELSFGCWVKLRIDDTESEISRVQDNDTIPFSYEEYEVETVKSVAGTEEDMFEIIGHPPRLNDYLAVLAETPYTWKLDRYGWIDVAPFPAGQEVRFHFDWKTGEPATEEDWKTYAELVGIKLDVWKNEHQGWKRRCFNMQTTQWCGDQ